MGNTATKETKLQESITSLCPLASFENCTGRFPLSLCYICPTLHTFFDSHPAREHLLDEEASQKLDDCMATLRVNLDAHLGAIFSKDVIGSFLLAVTNRILFDSEGNQKSLSRLPRGDQPLLNAANRLKTFLETPDSEQPLEVVYEDIKREIIRTLENIRQQKKL